MSESFDPKYEIILYWSTEDDAYVAEVPELYGCISHGSTLELALKNIQEAMALWLECAEEDGEVIPAPKGRRLMFA